MAEARAKSPRWMSPAQTGIWLIKLGARIIGLGVSVEPLETPPEIYEFLKAVFPRAAARHRRGTLASLGFPSHEDLARVGLTGEEFFDRYVRPAGPSFRNIEQHAQAVLSRFWSDYPQLRPPEGPA